MPTTIYVHRIVAIAGFTIFVETLVLIFLIRYVFKKKNLSLGQLTFAGIFASLATNPYVNFVFPRLAHWPYNTSLIVSETLVFFVEALFYRMYLRTDWRTSLIISAVCNFASWSLTLMLRTSGVTFQW